MQDRFKFRAKLKSMDKWICGAYLKMLPYQPSPVGHIKPLETEYKHLIITEGSADWEMPRGIEAYEVIAETVGQSTGLKDKNGKLIYEGDIIVIPNQYPFYDYKNKEDMKQDLNSTEGEIKGESILNYIGIVEWIYSQWQYVYHCVNPKKQGISEGMNQEIDFGFDFDEIRNTCYEVIGNIYENKELLNEI